MKKFYCTNEKNNCYKVKYNIVITQNSSDEDFGVCAECGFPLKEIPPSIFETGRQGIQKNIKIILPTFLLIIIGTILYFLYEPPMAFKNTMVKTALEDEPYNYQIIINNKKENTKIDVIEKPRWLIYDQSKQTLSGTPRNSHIGNHGVHIIAFIENQDTIHQKSIITIENVNDLPIISNTKGIKHAEEDSSYAQNILFSDADGDSSYILYIKPSNQWLKSKNNTLYGTPTPKDKKENNSKFTIFFSDGNDTANQTIDIPIILGNQPPQYRGSVKKRVNEDSNFNLKIDTRGKDFFDIDGDDIIVRFDLPQFLNETKNGRKHIISGTPNQSDVGSHTLVIHYTDEITKWQKSTIEVTVKPVNDAPVLQNFNDHISIIEGNDFLYQITYQDPENDPVNINIIKKPSWVTYDIKKQTLSGVARRGENKIIIELDDGSATTTETLKISVELPEEKKRALRWTPILYKDLNKQKVKTNIELEQLISQMETLLLLDELKEKFNIKGNNSKFYIVDPTDISYDGEKYYIGEKCFLVKMSTKKGIEIIIKENYKIRASQAPIYVIK